MAVWRVVGMFAWGVLVVGNLASEAVAQTNQRARLVIGHQTFTHPQRRSSALAIDATITSPAGIRKAEVFCRPAGARAFTALPMTHRGDNLYRAVVPDWLMVGKRLEYYITAVDQLGHSTSQGFVGFPFVVQLTAQRQLTQEERVRSLEDTLNLIRKSREGRGTGLYNDPLLERK